MVDDFDPIMAVKRAAMLAVTKESADFNLRELQRWYSETFCTELEKVEELPVEVVALHYFEVLYKRMSPEDREIEMRLLSETEDQRLDRLRKEELNSDSDDAFLRKIEEETAKIAIATKAVTKALETAIPGILDSSKPIAVEGQPLQSAVTKIPEGIDMEFVGEDELDDWDILGPPRKQ